MLVIGCGPERGTPDTLVYVTKSGKKYHRKECRLKTGSKGVKLGELDSKYEPCTRCNPPVLPKE